MAVSKTISAVGSHGYHTFTMTVTETAVNTSANTSTCSVKFTISPKVSGYDWEGYTSNPPSGTVYFNGSSWSWTLPNYNGRSTVTLVDKTVTVTHDSDGSKTITGSSSNSNFRFTCSSGDTYYLPGSASAYGSITLTKITRTPSVTQSLKSKTETAITMNWSSDVTIDRVRYSSNNGSSWTSKTVSAKSGSYTISGLSANTTYQIKTELRASASQLTATSAATSVKTYNWPKAVCPTVDIAVEPLDIDVTNPLERSCTMEVSVGGTVITTETDVTGGTVLYGFEEDFLTKIPNSSTGTYTVKVTYSGHTTTSTGTFTANGTRPTINSVSYQDTNSTAQAIIGNNQKILQNVSTPRFTVTGTPKYGATIASTRVVILNTVKPGTVSGNTGTTNYGVINSGSNVVAEVGIVDSRGYLTTKNITVQMIAYESPSATISLARENNYYSETDLTVNASVMNTGSNTPTITAKYREKGTSTWYNWANQSTLTNYTQYVQSLDNLKEWNVQIKVTDSFGGTKTYNKTVGIGLPILFIDRVMRALGVNAFPSEAGQVNIAGEVLSYPKELEPTVQSVSSVSSTNLKVYRSAGICMLTMELTLSAEIADWTTLATGMPVPATAPNNEWLDTAESWASSFKRPMRVRISTSGTLDIRYGAATSYRISMCYPIKP